MAVLPSPAQRRRRVARALRASSSLPVAALPALAAAAVTAVASVLLGLSELNVVHLATWTSVLAVTATAVLAFVANVAGALAPSRRARTRELADSLGFLLRTLAFTIQDLTDIDTRELGLAIYLQVPDRWPSAGLRAGGRVRLERIARDRAARRPTASGVVWRPGKGVVGACVATGAEVGLDIDTDSAPWADVPERDWPQVPDYVRAGLEWSEFRALQGKYFVVLATPILDSAVAGTSVLGALAVDGPAGSYEQLWTPDVRSALADAAETVRRFAL